MDRMIATALSAMASARMAQANAAQNLANQTVTGFRGDLPQTGRAAFVSLWGEQTARAMPTLSGVSGLSTTPGPMDPTGRPLDIAVDGPGWLYAQGDGRPPELTRRGDLTQRADGTLVNGAGQAMLDTALQPIRLPPARSVQIDDLGQIRVTPMAGGDDTTLVATLASVRAEGAPLVKGSDGGIRLANGTLPPPDQGATIRSGQLEGSNVNALAEMVDNIEIQRSYELNVRLVKEARDMDTAGARLLQLPEG